MRTSIHTDKMSHCPCGYILGEGYFTGCKPCIHYNGTKAPVRRGAIAHSIHFEDAFETPKKRPLPRPVPKLLGVANSGPRVHAQASAPHDAKRQAIKKHVNSAQQMPSGEKALKFVASFDAAVDTAPKSPPKKRSQTKEEADGILSASGWKRCSTKEGSFLNPNLEHDEYEVLFAARDGDCLFHCFVAILVEHGKWNSVKSKSEDISVIREMIAKCFTDNNNNVVGTAIVDGKPLEVEFCCENVEAIRSGKGGRSAYGGIGEIVAFGVLFDLAVTVFAPENEANGPVTYNPGNVDIEYPEEMFLNTLGWRGAKGTTRSPGCDHWQRVKKRQLVAPTAPPSRELGSNPEPIASPTASAPRELVSFADSVSREVVDVDAAAMGSSPIVETTAPPPPRVPLGEEDREGKRAAFRKQAEADKQKRDEEAVAKVKEFMESGGTFNFEEPCTSPEHIPSTTQMPSATELPPTQHISISSSESGDDDDNDVSSTSEGGDEADADGAEEDGQGGDGAEAEEDGQTRGKPRGRKASKTDCDDVTWTQETLITFLDTIVAHNPFEKCFSTRKKIGEKWDEIAVAMAEATKNLGVHAVVSTGDALRVKYAREKLRCKNYREGGKSKKMSGLASAKDKNLAELADHMDGCLNLQKEAEHNKDAKKNAVKSKQSYRQGVVEPAVIGMAAGNKRMQRKMLQLLHKSDQDLRKEQAYHEQNKLHWQPTPLQVQNMQMWQEAKALYPDAAKQAETEPQRRCRLSDQIAASMKLQEEWMKSQTSDPALEAALLDAVRSLTSAPMQVQGATQGGVPSSNKASRLQELKELLETGVITGEEYADARASVLRS